MPLSTMHCVPCQGGEPTATAAEKAEWSQEVPAWEVATIEGEERLARAFTFPDFAHALAFADRIGAAAEAEGHHPVLLVEWGRVTVFWWTHAIGGLHRNDFIMAAKTDDIYADIAQTPQNDDARLADASTDAL